jgi:hypothetical protein
MCGLTVNERTMDDHIKTHGTISPQDHETVEISSTEDPELTLEESVGNETNEENSE